MNRRGPWWVTDVLVPFGIVALAGLVYLAGSLIEPHL